MWQVQSKNIIFVLFDISFDVNRILKTKINQIDGGHWIHKNIVI